MDGTVACWGAADDGLTAAPAGTFESLVVGDECACALDQGGHARCWGRLPTAPPNLPAPKDDTVFLQVVAGGTYVCGLLKDGHVVCWGEDGDGRHPPAETFTEIAAGFTFACGLRPDETARCWGEAVDLTAMPKGPYSHLLARGDQACFQRGDTWVCLSQNLEPKLAPPPGQKVISLALGRGYALEAGKVVPWGPDPFFSPDPPTGTIAALTVSDFGCALSPDGTLDCWGLNHTAPEVEAPLLKAAAAGDGIVCGIPRDPTSDIPDCWGGNLKFPKGLRPRGSFKQVGVGSGYACFLRDDGKLACWGDNPDSYSLPPLYGQVPAGTFTSLVVGPSQACALAQNGQPACFGSAPITPPAEPFTALAVGDAHACGLRPDQTVKCWGSNSDGQSQPPGGAFAKIAAGTKVSCGIRADRTLACWGSKEDGRNSPPPGRFTDLSAGRHTCAVREDGRLICWGAYRFSGR